MHTFIFVDQMLIFADVWVVAATQTASAKYGRFSKTLLIQYDPGWSPPGPPHFFFACASLEYGPWLSFSIWVYSRRKHRSVKQHFENEVPTVEIGLMHYYLYLTSSESTISRQVSGIVSYLLHVPTEPGIF